MIFSSDEMRALLAEVEAELEPLLRAERSASMEKAAPGEESSMGSASPMGEGSMSPGGREASAGERSGGMVADEAPEGSAGGEQSMGADEGAGEEDVQALAAEYAKLDPKELEMHLLALQAAMKQMMGDEGSAGPAPAPEASAAPAPAPAMKSEKSMSAKKAEGSVSASKSASAKKAEHSMSASKSMSAKKAEKKDEESSEESSSESSEVTMSKSEFDALSKKIELVTRAVEVLAKPMRKAVTEANIAPEKTALTKSEITAKLRTATANPAALTKSDRDLVVGFYEGRVSVDQIGHLLK